MNLQSLKKAAQLHKITIQKATSNEYKVSIIGTNGSWFSKAEKLQELVEGLIERQNFLKSSTCADGF